MDSGDWKALWRPFLEAWSRQAFASRQPLNDVPAEAVRSGWLGYPGATEEQLAQLEARLGARLPPSYRAFLSTTNGWWQPTGYDEQYQFWSTEQVEWMAVRNQEWIDGWLMGWHCSDPAPPHVPDDEYFVYGKDQTPAALREEYFSSLLEVSAEALTRSIYVLNPQIVTAEGEWEAWYWDHDEITRYRSFWEMLQAAHEQFQLRT